MSVHVELRDEDAAWLVTLYRWYAQTGAMDEDMMRVLAPYVEGIEDQLTMEQMDAARGKPPVEAA